MPSLRNIPLTVAMLLAALGTSHAAEHIILANGQYFDCTRHEPQGDTLRLYFAAENYVDIPARSVVRIETLPDPPAAVVAAPLPPAPAQPAAADLKELLSHAGAEHNIDSELLASVVHAESGGQIHAISRTGARGLMQLMPGTAMELGVSDAFQPAQNVEGGTRYLDQLLTRYHDDIAKALAAYNAGPAAVDRYHGVPPFRETRAYVARVENEFIRRKHAGGGKF